MLGVSFSWEESLLAIVVKLLIYNFVMQLFLSLHLLRQKNRHLVSPQNLDIIIRKSFKGKKLLEVEIVWSQAHIMINMFDIHHMKTPL